MVWYLKGPLWSFDHVERVLTSSWCHLDISQISFCSVLDKRKLTEIIKTTCPLCTVPGFFVSLAVIVDICFHSGGQQAFVAVGMYCSVEIKRERNLFLFDRYAAFNSCSASVLALHSKRTNTSYSRDSLLSFMRENERYSSWFLSSLSRKFTSQVAQMVMHGASGTEKAHVDTSDLQFLPCTNKTRSYLLHLKQQNLGTRIPLRLFQELLGSSKFNTEKDNFRTF